MCFHKFFLARFSKFTKLPFPAITCASHSIVATSLISQFHDFFKLILAGFCYLPQLTTAAAQCCHSPAMGLNNAHCFRGMSKLKCSAVLHSLDESWLLFLPGGLGRDCVKLDFFFQNSFSTFGVVALQFHPRNFITAFIRHLFSIFVLILRVIQIIFASCISIQYIQCKSCYV